ncbi:MAG TPA: hypothetical protein PKW55_06490 [Spirochaetota bacterium]|nr:hypothetical protein [Spirochaetota bacterium]HOM38532.1 hypothetical protein [Spirochaetota bacterium]HPQ49072.1 hypothetical protein [Spirochaetota bacterium]
MEFYFDFRNESYDPSFIPSINNSYCSLIEDNIVKIGDFDSLDTVFVDGVMRKEANIVVEENKLINLALFSVASGGILVNKNIQSYLLEDFISVKRVIITNIGDEVIKDNIRYKWNNLFKDTILYLPIIETDKDFSVTNYLRVLESSVAENISNTELLKDSLIILDGPLQMSFKKRVIGLVKTIREMYLTEKEFLSLKDTKVRDSRSGIFIIETPEKKYSWYIRLTDGIWFYNMLRLEAFYSSFSLEEIINIADFTAYFLPGLVNQFDNRTPQNLAPVSYLEKFLKTLLGNSDIIEYIIKSKRE